VALYHCPGDTVSVTFGGTTYSRARDYSMNAFMNGNPSDSSTAYPSYIDNKKSTDILHPGAVDAMVFTEEDRTTIDDGCFGVNPDPTTTGINNIPAEYHGKGTTFGFADGHAAYVSWRTKAIPADWSAAPAGDSDILNLKSMEAVHP
jgi:prepilin-type processing-associated H-X9-DG protein